MSVKHASHYSALKSLLSEEMRKSASTLYQFSISDPTLLFRNACENVGRLTEKGMISLQKVKLATRTDSRYSMILFTID